MVRIDGFSSESAPTVKASLSDVLSEASRRQGAAGAFTCYTVEGAAAVVDAADQANSAVILLVGARSLASRTGDQLVVAMLSIAAAARVGVCVQLDHVADLSAIRHAVDLGVDAVMVDGGSLPIEQNVALCRAVLDVGARSGLEIEAELGVISGDEDRTDDSTPDQLTSPDHATALCDAVSVASLAVSIGNVHGRYRTPPVIDLMRLESIAARVPVPLALHGASGLDRAQVDRSIDLGIRKVNVNTELREAWFAESRRSLEEHQADLSILGVLDDTGSAVTRATTRWLRVLQRDATS